MPFEPHFFSRWQPQAPLYRQARCTSEGQRQGNRWREA